LFRTLLLLFFNHLTALRQFGHKRNVGANEKSKRANDSPPASAFHGRPPATATNKSWGRK
jgi:hypothetical protein